MAEASLVAGGGLAIYLAGQGEEQHFKTCRLFEDEDDLEFTFEAPEDADPLSSAYRSAFEKVRDLIRKHSEKYVRD